MNSGVPDDSKPVDVFVPDDSKPVDVLVPDDSKPVDVLGATLETFIVGRRHADNPDEICAGTAISLLRDPENVKDPNAVKVCSFFPLCNCGIFCM